MTNRYTCIILYIITIMENNTLDENTYWHSAFLPALQLELEEYLNALLFESTYELNTKPLIIDVIVIKKIKNITINNPIAKIFKQYNVFEYKSPHVSLSLDAFYKAISYVFLYKTINRVDIMDMTLSVVLTRHPRVVFEHITNEWKYGIKEKERGIYVVEGFLFPIQIIESKKLSVENNAFLRNLGEDLDVEALEWAIQLESEDRKIDISAYVDIISRANAERFKEMTEMTKSPVLRKIIDERAQVIAEERVQKLAIELAKEQAQVIAEELAEKRAQVIVAEQAQELVAERLRELAERNPMLAKILEENGFIKQQDA